MDADVIIGGGLAGLVASNALVRVGKRVAILDHRLHPAGVPPSYFLARQPPPSPWCPPHGSRASCSRRWRADI
jgi:cation diffusion facilitator CzcD-associated flavoprotein CzcO